MFRFDFPLLPLKEIPTKQMKVLLQKFGKEFIRIRLFYIWITFKIINVDFQTLGSETRITSPLPNAKSYYYLKCSFVSIG